MKTLLILLTSVLISPLARAEALVTVSNGGLVNYAQVVQDLVAKANPKYKFMQKTQLSEDVEDFFEKLKESPVFLKSDFNGDGQPDLALLVEDGENTVALAVVSDKKSFRLIEVDRWDKAETRAEEITYLSLLKKSDVKVKKGSKRKAVDVIQVEVYFGPTKAFFISGDKAQPYYGEIH